LQLSLTVIDVHQNVTTSGSPKYYAKPYRDPYLYLTCPFKCSGG
jgi:hypothetical protein